MTATVFAVLNQKGGVGKTTTVFHLARAAVRTGRKVLLVDADPQGSLTLIAAAEDAVQEDQIGLADVLSKRASETIEDAIVEGIWPNLSLVPTMGEALGDVRDELVISGAGRELRLRQALAPVLEQYDLILIDCGPTLDQLTVNALSAADKVIIVTESKLLSAAGMSKMLSTVEVVKSAYRPNLEVAGVILNKHEKDTISGQHWKREIVSAHPILEPPIPKSTVVSDAAEAASGLDEWPSSRAKQISGYYDRQLKQLEGSNS